MIVGDRQCFFCFFLVDEGQMQWEEKEDDVMNGWNRMKMGEREEEGGRGNKEKKGFWSASGEKRKERKRKENRK